jgi:hypothetical protein
MPPIGLPELLIALVVTLIVGTPIAALIVFVLLLKDGTIVWRSEPKP